MPTEKAFDLARQAHDQRRFEEAEAICLEALHQTPDDATLEEMDRLWDRAKRETPANDD